MVAALALTDDAVLKRAVETRVREAVARAQEALITGRVPHQPGQEGFYLQQVEGALAAHDALLRDAGGVSSSE